MGIVMRLLIILARDSSLQKLDMKKLRKMYPIAARSIIGKELSTAPTEKEILKINIPIKNTAKEQVVAITVHAKEIPNIYLLNERGVIFKRVYTPLRR